MVLTRCRLQSACATRNTLPAVLSSCRQQDLLQGAVTYSPSFRAHKGNVMSVCDSRVDSCCQGVCSHSKLKQQIENFFTSPRVTSRILCGRGVRQGWGLHSQPNSFPKKRWTPKNFSRKVTWGVVWNWDSEPTSCGELVTHSLADGSEYTENCIKPSHFSKLRSMPAKSDIQASCRPI